ncbi:MAG: hypothetical protein ACK5FF_19745 [Planctomyces sp.]
MSSPAKFPSVIRILPAAGLVVLLTAPTGCAGDGIRGMLPWGGKKDYQPLETQQAAEKATDEEPQEAAAETARPAAKTAAQTSGSAPAAKRSSWSPFGRSGSSREDTAAAKNTDAEPKPGLFRNPFRRTAARPADPFVETAGEDAPGDAENEAEEGSTSAETVKKSTAPTARATGGRQPVATAGKVQRASGGRAAGPPATETETETETNLEAETEFTGETDFAAAERADADAAADALLKRMETGAVTNPVRRTTRAAAVAADRTRTAVDRSVNAVAELGGELAEEELTADTAAEPLIRRASPTRQITRTAAAVEEQKLQELDALISGSSARAARSASKVTSAALQKTETAAGKVQAAKSAVQRSAKTHEDSALREFDELTGRVAETDQSARSAVRRSIRQTAELTEDLEFSMEEPTEDAEPMGDMEPVADSELMADSESMEDMDAAAAEESAESPDSADLADDTEPVVEDEFPTEPAEEQRVVPRVQPRTRRAPDSAAAPAALRSKAPGDGFEWQSGSKTGAGSKTVQGGAAAKPRVTRPATLTREVAEPAGDLEQVEEWLSSPVSAPTPPKSQQRPIRRSSWSDPFVQAEDAEAADSQDDSVSGGSEEMQLDESFGPSGELPELPEPPEAAAGLAVPAGAAESGAEPGVPQSVFSRLSPVSWVILSVGTVCILALLFFPSRRKAGTNGTAVIPA